MLTYEEIMNYCSNYKIDNGIIIDKKTNKQVLDEDAILKIKSSVLIFKEAKESYQSDIQQFGNIIKTPEDYIKLTMEKFGVNNEKNYYGVNKLINALLSSNGHYEENKSGKDLLESKFSILVGAKQDYGVAYLKLKFREKGLDIEDLKVSQDLSELQQNGISKVIIDFKVKKYQKINNIQKENKPILEHPKAQELNELERKKQLAKQTGNQEEYNHYQSLIEKIVKENELSITPDEWDKLSDEEKVSFYKIKMKESKVFKDEVSYNYWGSNLKRLQDKQKEKSNTQNICTSTVNNTEPDLSGSISELKNKLMKIKQAYYVMLKDGYIDNQELGILTTMIGKVIDDGYSLKGMATNLNDTKTITSIIGMLEEEQNKMKQTQYDIKENGRSL